jgi:uncharacterized protein (TIGR01777 family)
MRVAVTGGSGLIGRAVVAALRERGDTVTVFSRGEGGDARWDPMGGPAPADVLSSVDAVVHLAGENVAQRWTDSARRAIRESRVVGTENLLAGLRDASPRPGVLVSASAVGYYGDRGAERLDEQSAPGEDFLAEVCVAWERAAQAAEGMRVAVMRTGVVLAPGGGALARMLTPFRLGVGGPVAGGAQYMPWIHVDDVCGMYLAALDDERWSGALNMTAPVPVTNREFSLALGRVLHRPARMPVPALAMRALYGEMSAIVLGGQNAVPARALELGYAFRRPELDDALRSAV